MLRREGPEVKGWGPQLLRILPSAKSSQASLDGQPKAAVPTWVLPIRRVLLPKGVTWLCASRYNQSVMLPDCDAAEKSQYEFARVVAALPGVSAAVSGQSA